MNTQTQQIHSLETKNLYQKITDEYLKAQQLKVGN